MCLSIEIRRVYKMISSLRIMVIGLVMLSMSAAANQRSGSHEPMRFLRVSGSEAIRAFTMEQDATGMTDDDITLDEVGRWAEYGVNLARQSGRQVCKEKGGSEAVCKKIDAEEVHQVVNGDGHRVAIINFRIFHDEVTYSRAIRVVSLIGSKMVSVSCAVDSPTKIVTPTMSPCAEEIQKSFGFRFPAR